ncbi:hypothetical protein llap_8218 [Limosa lapponica baueri]|uniref:Uncharacterized protein n=1 Tax=Limosa lapponica baueri TaxID=1758121 RepID=A0A2I0U5Z5_LIMLA|nr:hypothetical protein llap_8218 [Limosa lapponica baueri]
MVPKVVRLLENMTFEEMLTELGLFKVKKRKPIFLLLTSTAWWKDIGKGCPFHTNLLVLPSESTRKAEGPLQINSKLKQRQNCVGYSRQETEAEEQDENLENQPLPGAQRGSMGMTLLRSSGRDLLVSCSRICFDFYLESCCKLDTAKWFI